MLMPGPMLMPLLMPLLMLMLMTWQDTDCLGHAEPVIMM